MAGSVPPAVLAEVTLEGHLTARSLGAALVPVTRQLIAVSQARLLVDCLKMTGYDADAREAFVEWNRAHRHRIERVAIVTEKLGWYIIIRAMSLAARLDMRPFTERAPARGWLVKL